MRRRQYTLKFRKALAQQLKNGNAPNIATINSQVSKELVTHKLGYPKSKYKPIEHNTVSDPISFNQSFSDIYEDLSSSMEELSYLAEQTQNTKMMHENNRLRLTHQMYLLSRRIFNFNIRTQVKQYTAFNTFADFKYIDFLGDAQRGIPKTTAFVDIKKHCVTLPSDTAEAMFVSAPHSVPPLLSATLQVDHSIPAETTISYFVAIDNDNQKANWHPIIPGKEILLSPFGATTSQIDNTNQFFGTLGKQYYGVQHYVVGNIPLNASKLSLYLGSKMWAHEHVHTAAQSPTPGLHNWANPIDKQFKLNRLTSTFDLEHNAFNKHTIYVFADQAISVTSRIQLIGLGSFVVFLNNSQIHGVNKYAMNFARGWNKLEICSHTVDTNAQIITDFDPYEVGTKIYAINTPLQQVEPHDLYHNVFSTNYNIFAIEDHKIIVNYNPLSLSQNGAIYDLFYYSNTNQQENQIRLMARLTSKNPKNLPLINEYRIITN